VTDDWNKASPEAQELAAEYYEIDLAEMLVTARATIIRARELHRETCPFATASVKPTAFTCSMCDTLDEPKDQT